MSIKTTKKEITRTSRGGISSMCKYCKNDTNELYKDSCNSHEVILKLSKFPNDSFKLGIDIYCTCDDLCFLDYIDIKYCPMCGRKLEKFIKNDFDYIVKGGNNNEVC